MKLENPFPEYGYFGPEYFCDREQETEELISALVNGSNVTLMGYSSRHTQVLSLRLGRRKNDEFIIRNNSKYLGISKNLTTFAV